MHQMKYIEYTHYESQPGRLGEVFTLRTKWVYGGGVGEGGGDIGAQKNVDLGGCLGVQKLLCFSALYH